MMTENVKISVIMGVYNQRDRMALRQAVKSILNQTFTEFEFIIYDDGSDEDAGKYIEELEQLDRRIVLIREKENNGLAFSLNSCIAKAKGKYIARMDADDVSLPNRLAVQYNFMEKHPMYAWCGCNAKLFDEYGIWGSRAMVERPESTDYLKYSPYIHPSVMYRREIFDEGSGYLEEEETLRCEDYDIFMRLYQRGLRGYNLQRYLFYYREDRISYNKRKFRFRINEAIVRYRNFKAMDMLFPKGWLYVLRPIVGGFIPVGMIAWLKRKESSHRDECNRETSAEVSSYIS